MSGDGKALVGLLLIPVILVSSLPVSTPARVAPDTYALGTAYNSERKIVVDPSGSIYIAYSTLAKNGSYFVEVAVSRDGGDSWSDLPGVPSAANSSRSALALAPSGAVDLVWTEGAPVRSQIYFSSFSGGSWSPKILLSNSSYYSGYPSIVVDSKGGAHVVWYGFDGTYYEIYYTRSNGTTWTPPHNLSTLKEDSLNPSIAVDAAGNLYVTWYAEVSRYFQIYYAEFKGNWSVPVAITTRLADSTESSLAIQPDGKVNIVWATAINNIDQVFMMTGQDGLWGPKAQLTNGSDYAANPTQTFAPNGTAIVFWTAAGDVYGCAVRGSCAPYLVYSTGYNSYPSAEWPVRAGSGGVLLMWTSSSPTENGTEETVLFANVVAPGTSNAPLLAYGLITALAFVAIVIMIVRKLPKKNRIQSVGLNLSNRTELR